jgi:hypothetical protein
MIDSWLALPSQLRDATRKLAPGGSGGVDWHFDYRHAKELRDRAVGRFNELHRRGPAYREEMQEVGDAVQPLRVAILEYELRHQIPNDVVHYVPRRGHGGNPNPVDDLATSLLTEPTDGMFVLPSIAVRRVGQTAAVAISPTGRRRARVSDVYELLLDCAKVPNASGPRKLVMRYAFEALQLGPGIPPYHLTVYGRARTRALYDLRKSRRRR